MNQPQFWLKITRPGDSIDKPLLWLATSRGNVIDITLPTGSSIQVPNSAIPLVSLASLSAAAPGIDEVPMFQRVEITCSPTVQAALPLWLRPSDKEQLVSEHVAECITAIEEQIRWASYSPSHCIFINGLQWAVISVRNERSDASWAAVPVSGDWYLDWFHHVYASFGFVETASRTSGWDSSVCGLLTPQVFAFVDSFDEGDAFVTLRTATNAAADLRDWIWSSELANRLRETWDIPFGEDDFIDWGFLQLAKTGKSEVELNGLKSSNDDYLGMGLTNSSKWSFTCSLASNKILSAVGDMADRRPGT